MRYPIKGQSHSLPESNMTSLSPEEIWDMSKNEVGNLLKSRPIPKKKKIVFYSPSFANYRTKHYCSSKSAFPTISITGSACSLNCKHCAGQVLKTMHRAVTPQELMERGIELKRKGAKGVLISGGCLPDGSIPLNEFTSTIKWLKLNLGLTVFVHTGVIDSNAVLKLKDAGVDAALIDVIGSEATIAKICNGSALLKDYSSSLSALNQGGLKFIPHVIVGLNEGRLEGEFTALQMIKQVKPSAIVIIAFMPIRGTPMEKTPPPEPIDIAKVIILARTMFPNIPLALGCMRPKGVTREEIDELALRAGVDAIAFPSESIVEFVKSHNYAFSFSPYCCAQMYLDMAKN